MNNDQTARSARRLATLIAIPVALIAGLVAFQVLKPQPTPQPLAEESPATVQASSPVSLPAPPLGERHATVCRALLAMLPDEIRDRPRRQVTGGHEQNAAYGDPAITLSCGGEVPEFQPTDFVYPLNEVCWFADQTGTKWTTVDREVPVTVYVPRDYDAPGGWVILFSTPVDSAVAPISGDLPFGCTGEA